MVGSWGRPGFGTLGVVPFRTLGVVRKSVELSDGRAQTLAGGTAGVELEPPLPPEPAVQLA
jgi:hypothetical protein